VDRVAGLDLGEPLDLITDLEHPRVALRSLEGNVALLHIHGFDRK